MALCNMNTQAIFEAKHMTLSLEHDTIYLADTVLTESEYEQVKTDIRFYSANIADRASRFTTVERQLYEKGISKAGVRRVAIHFEPGVCNED